MDNDKNFKSGEGIVRRERTPGEIVVARRKELGWTQEELAWRCGVSMTTISRVENDARKTSVETISKLEETLGISLLNVFIEYRKMLDPGMKSYLATPDAIRTFERELAKAGLSDKELGELLDSQGKRRSGGT